MTEEKWLAAQNPLNLLLHVRRTSPGLRTRAGRRKFRLFACACAWRLPTIRSVEPYRRGVEAAEGVVEGTVTNDERMEVSREILTLPPHWDRTITYQILRSPTWKAVTRWRRASHPDRDRDRGNSSIEEKRALADLVRCLFGNPFRPVAFDPAWRTSTAVTLASAAYDSRDFATLPILADALEDAGCTDAAVLAHCRDTGPHARGCWVVDGLLGKS